jgi:hypothetical protein
MIGPADLRRRYAEMLKAHDAKLDALEKQEQALGGEQRRALYALFTEAGEDVAIAAGLEDPYYDACPPKSDLPEGVKLVEFD